MSTSDRYRVTKTVTPDQIDWKKLESSLARRARCTQQRAEKDVHQFARAVRQPLSLVWFLGDRLRCSFTAVAECLCGLLGADQIIITTSRRIRVAALGFHYRQRLLLIPRAEQGQASAVDCIPTVDLSLLGIHWSLQHLWQALFVHFVFFVLAVGTYVLFVGLALYGLSAFVLFLQRPDLVGHDELFLPLVCFLVAVVTAIRTFLLRPSRG